jgi:hypothetical protein
MPQFLDNAIRALVPSQYYFQVLGLLAIIVVLLWLALVREEKRPNYVLGIVISILLLMIMASDVTDRWAWMLGLLPTLLVAYQAFYLWLSKPEEVQSNDSLENYRLQQARERVGNTIDTQFGPKTLFIRYGFPAALLGIIGIVVLNVLVKPGQFLSLITLNQDTIVRINPVNAAKLLLGVRLGALGAYVYVLLELGRRTFRHDVTGASAMWCLVTLILGPVLAGTVSVLLRMETPLPDDKTWWAGGVVLFFAGYAPRRVIAAIEQAAIQLLKIGGSAVAPTRQVPLSQIRGIGPQIEDRLSEEGIDDVNALASAEPIRLFRNTSFDLRQVITWIDEAILMVTLPRHWQALEEEGITGAIDLAWYQPPALPRVASGIGTAAPLVAAAEIERQQKKMQDAEGLIRNLAVKIKMDPDNLMATIERLYEDHQVQNIWALYNSFAEASARTGTGDGGANTKSTDKGTDQDKEPKPA